MSRHPLSTNTLLATTLLTGCMLGSAAFALTTSSDLSTNYISYPAGQLNPKLVGDAAKTSSNADQAAAATGAAPMAVSGGSAGSGSPAGSGNATASATSKAASAPGNATTLAKVAEKVSQGNPVASQPTVLPTLPSLPGSLPSQFQVPAGCAVPKTAILSAFYVDPVNGNDTTGDGSKAKPWKTVALVLSSKISTISMDHTGATKAVNPNGPVKPGSAIYLMNGEHSMPARFPSYYNPDFITLAAAPGHKPLVHGSITYGGMGKWIFSGLTYDKQLIIRGGGAKIPRDIIVMNNTFRSSPDAAQWTLDQWKAGGIMGMTFEAECGTVAGNLFQFVTRGFSVGGNKLLVKNNFVDFYVEDGINFTADNLTLVGNTVTNHYGKWDSGNHNDAIQGWRLDGIANTNLIVDSNVVIESTGKYAQIPPVPGSGGPADYTQGITIFDGFWKNFRITNNIVYASAYHGLTMSGGEDGVIANNVVIGANADPKRKTWLRVGNKKGGLPPKNVIVRNNIATTFTLVTPTQSDHNVTLTDPTAMFVKFDKSRAAFDFHLKDGSPAIGAGTTELAPLTDITGAKRITQMDAGAYDYRR